MSKTVREREYIWWSYNINGQGSLGFRHCSSEAVTEGQELPPAPAWAGGWKRTATGVRFHRATWKVGQVVEVHAYGRWRIGTVTKLNPRRLVIKYKRNQQGDHSERSFHPNEIRADNPHAAGLATR